MCTGTSWLVFALGFSLHGCDMYFAAWRQMLPYGVGVPGVLSVQLDKNFESENKDYGGLYVFQIISLCVFLMFDQI